MQFDPSTSTNSGNAAKNQPQDGDDWAVIEPRTGRDAASDNGALGLIISVTIGADPKVATGNETQVPFSQNLPMRSLRATLEGLRDGQSVSCGQITRAGSIRYIAGRPALMLATCPLTALPPRLQFQVRFEGPQRVLTRFVPQLGQAGLIGVRSKSEQCQLVIFC
jgi:hypothetical protein